MPKPYGRAPKNPPAETAQDLPQSNYGGMPKLKNGNERPMPRVQATIDEEEKEYSTDQNDLDDLHRKGAYFIALAIATDIIESYSVARELIEAASRKFEEDDVNDAVYGIRDFINEARKLEPNVLNEYARLLDVFAEARANADLAKVGNRKDETAETIAQEALDNLNRFLDSNDDLKHLLLQNINSISLLNVYHSLDGRPTKTSEFVALMNKAQVYRTAQDFEVEKKEIISAYLKNKQKVTDRPAKPFILNSDNYNQKPGLKKNTKNFLQFFKPKPETTEKVQRFLDKHIFRRK